MFLYTAREPADRFRDLVGGLRASTRRSCSYAANSTGGAPLLATPAPSLLSLACALFSNACWQVHASRRSRATVASQWGCTGALESRDGQHKQLPPPGNLTLCAWTPTAVGDRRGGGGAVSVC